MKLKLKKKSREDDEETVADALPKGNWAKQGFQHVRAPGAGGGGKWLPQFFIKEDGASAMVRFQMDEPTVFLAHSIKMNNRWTTRTCIEPMGQSCPMCEAGNKRRQISAFSLIDRRKEKWQDKEGKTVKRENTVKVWLAGPRAADKIKKMSKKRGSLTSYDLEVTRVGEGKDTDYMLLPEVPEPMSSEDRKQPLAKITELYAPKSRQEILAEMGRSDDDEEEVATKY